MSELDIVSHRMAYMQTVPELHHDLTTLRKKWMRQVAVDTGEDSVLDQVTFERDFVELGFQVFWRERNNVVLYSGVLDMLESLSKKYSLGVITNGNADVNYIGIGHFFDFTLSSEEAGVAKPHEAIFNKAKRLSTFGFDEIIYVGDNPQCDVLGPQKVGMRSIWYNPTLKPWPSGQNPAAIFQYHHQLEDKISKL